VKGKRLGLKNKAVWCEVLSGASTEFECSNRVLKIFDDLEERLLQQQSFEAFSCFRTITGAFEGERDVL